jgi:signal transduction histidine kinase
VVWRRHAGRFSLEVVNLLQTFASQSCLAINNARLFREIEDKGHQLEVASRHKSRFLANMSHELRTPLNAILGYTELIADNIYGEVPERMGEVLDRVDKSGRHLLGLINDILDLSKIEAGQLKLTLVDYSMEDIARSVAAAAEPLAAAKQLALVVSVAPDLPLGWGDAPRLNQVLLNLVGNAIKFTDTKRVTVEARAAGDAFVIAVTDTGPGIAETDRERIFEEFQQTRHAPPRRPLPPRPRHALSARGQARAGPRAPRHRDDEVRRDGHAFLAGAGGGRDEGVDMRWTTASPFLELTSLGWVTLGFRDSPGVWLFR